MGPRASPEHRVCVINLAPTGGPLSQGSASRIGCSNQSVSIMWAPTDSRALLTYVHAQDVRCFPLPPLARLKPDLNKLRLNRRRSRWAVAPTQHLPPRLACVNGAPRRQSQSPLFEHPTSTRGGKPKKQAPGHRRRARDLPPPGPRHGTRKGHRDT
jgi:hypothetical protein